MYSIREKLDRIKQTRGEPDTIEEFANVVPNMINDLLHKKNLCGISWEITKHALVSNTHCCPIGGVTNWGSKPDKPTGYSGWIGRIWVAYRGEMHGRGGPYFEDSSSALKALRLHTGTGGYGSYRGPWHDLFEDSEIRKLVSLYSWDLKFFDADWPLKKTNEDYEKQLMLQRLRGTDLTAPRLKHTMRWENDFITSCRVIS